MRVQGLAISSRTARHRPTRRARGGKRCWHHQSNDSDCPAGPHPGKTNHLHWSCHRQRWRSPPCRSRRKQKTRNSRRRGCSIEPQKCFTAMASPQESAGSLEPSTTGGVRWALRRTKHSATGRWRISWPLTTPTPQWLQRTPAQDRMVSKLLSAAHLDFPLTPLHIKTVAGALKEAGYKSTFSYGTWLRWKPCTLNSIILGLRC